MSNTVSTNKLGGKSFRLLTFLLEIDNCMRQIDISNQFNELNKDMFLRKREVYPYIERFIEYGLINKDGAIVRPNRIEIMKFLVKKSLASKPKLFFDIRAFGYSEEIHSTGCEYLISNADKIFYCMEEIFYDDITMDKLDMFIHAITYLSMLIENEKPKIKLVRIIKYGEDKNFNKNFQRFYISNHILKNVKKNDICKLAIGLRNSFPLKYLCCEPEIKFKNKEYLIILDNIKKSINFPEFQPSEKTIEIARIKEIRKNLKSKKFKSELYKTLEKIEEHEKNIKTVKKNIYKILQKPL